MPNPARLVVYGKDKKPLTGPIPIDDSDNSDLTGSEIHEFSHQVYTIEKDYFYALLYGIDFVRQHKPLALIKPVDRMSVPLVKNLAEGTFLPKVEVRWYVYLEDYLNVREYFRMTMEHVRLHTMKMIIPDVKHRDFETYGHLEQVTFCYQKMTWLYKKGNLEFTDIWNDGFFAEEYEKDFGAKKDEIDLVGDAVELIDKLVVTFKSGSFAIAPEEVAFDEKARVTFTASFNRKANMKERKVYAKLFAVCKGKTEDLRQVQEGRLSEDGEWTTTFTLRKPEILANEEDAAKEQVEYYAVIENAYAANNNYKSDSIKTLSKVSVVYLENDDGEPMVGVIVVLLKDGDAVKEYTTDSDGKVEIEVDTSDGGEYSLILSQPEITEAHFENEAGEKLDKVKKDTTVFLVVTTANMIGKTVDIDLSDSTINFEHNGQVLENDMLKELEITDDVMRIELKTCAEEVTAV